jgi:hypothetical protein
MRGSRSNRRRPLRKLQLLGRAGYRFVIRPLREDLPTSVQLEVRGGYLGAHFREVEPTYCLQKRKSRYPGENVGT